MIDHAIVVHVLNNQYPLDHDHCLLFIDFRRNASSKQYKTSRKLVLVLGLVSAKTKTYSNGHKNMYRFIN